MRINKRGVDMPKVKDVIWIKFETTMFEEDDKIDYIESLPEKDAILLIWIKLQLLAGKCNMGGFIYLTEKIPYTIDMLAHKFRRPFNVVRLAVETFEFLGMIETIDGVICIVDFSADQNSEKLDAIREYNRLAKQTERAKKRALLPSNNDKSKKTVNEMSLTNVIDSQENCQTDFHDSTLTCHGSQNTDIDDRFIDKEYKEDDNDVNSINNIYAMHKETSTTTSDPFSENVTTEAFYELNIGKLSPIVNQGLAIYRIKGISDDVIKMAVITAVYNSTETKDKRNWSYISAILDDCVSKNIKTLEEFQAKENAFQEAKRKFAAGSGKCIDL
jgi:predicted phage replisome organizer